MIYAILLIALALVVAFLFIAGTAVRIARFKSDVDDLLNHAHERIAKAETRLKVAESDLRDLKPKAGAKP